MSTKPATAQRLHFAVPGTFAVDRAKGTLTGLSLITANREAKGHGLYIDAETLATGAAVVAARGGRLKGAIRHGSYAEYMDTGMDRVMDFPGWFSAIAIKGEQLVAGLFEFYDTFKADNAAAYNRLIEMAEKTPDLFGISIEVWGYAVYVATDGKEFGQRPEGVELKYDGLPALRITDLSYAAFVDEPAANSGLFAQLSRALGVKFGGKPPAAVAPAELVAAVTAWAAGHEKENTVRVSASSEPTPLPPTNSALSTMQIIATLKAKYGTDPKKFAAAMLIVGTTPAEKLATLTVEAVDAELGAADLSTLRAEHTQLTADLAAAKAKITELTTAVATATAATTSLQAKYDRFKASGREDGVNLGAPSSGAGQPTVNPWLKATKNLSQQAEITKQFPELAAQFQAAAATANAAK